MLAAYRYCLLALLPLVVDACSTYGGEDCTDACSSQKFEVGFFDRTMERIDSLEQDSVRLEVVGMVSASRSAGAAVDCDACQNRFTQSQLLSDRPVRTPGGQILPPSTNLLGLATADRVGTEGKFSLTFFQATTLEKGTHNFTFKARMDGTEVTAKGALWIPDSLGF